MITTKAWIKAFRLRTLPLAFSTIITGTAIAVQENKFHGLLFIFAITTTLFLQILSNLANDYGDFIKGTDNQERIGPTRALQSGVISKKGMIFGIYTFILLSLFSGILLLYIAGQTLEFSTIVGFFILGVFAILAALLYTIGKKAYGYNGLGDVFVFLFFGLIGVGGSTYLMIQEFNLIYLLPAASIGMLSAAVLNLNNMRDVENDKKSNKKTLVVKLGLELSKIYHYMLFVFAFLFLITFTIITFNHPVQFLYLLALPIFILHIKRVISIKISKIFDPELKIVALSTFLTSLLFMLGNALNYYF